MRGTNDESGSGAIMRNERQQAVVDALRLVIMSLVREFGYWESWVRRSEWENLEDGERWVDSQGVYVKHGDGA